MAVSDPGCPAITPSVVAERAAGDETVQLTPGGDTLLLPHRCMWDRVR